MPYKKMPANAFIKPFHSCSTITFPFSLKCFLQRLCYFLGGCSGLNLSHATKPLNAALQEHCQYRLLIKNTKCAPTPFQELLSHCVVKAWAPLSFIHLMMYFLNDGGFAAAGAAATVRRCLFLSFPDATLRKIISLTQTIPASIVHDSLTKNLPMFSFLGIFSLLGKILKNDYKL